MNFRSTQFVLVVACISTFRVCSGQVTVTVGDGKMQIDAANGTETVITCQYEANPGHVIDSVDGLQWKKENATAGSSDPIGSISAAGMVSYDPPYSEPAYVISSTDVNEGCNLTIRSVSDADSGTYRCLVFVRDPTLRDYSDTTILDVYVRAPPSAIKLSIDGKLLQSNDVIYVDPMASYDFTCTVPDIRPGVASFRWTLNNTNLVGLRLPDEVDGSTGLITCSSNATLIPTAEDNGKHLQCEALNEDDKGTIAIRVILNVTSRASTTPESTNASTTIGGPGPSAPKEVSTTGTTTMVSTSTDPPTPGSTTWMVIGGTDQRILITDEVDRGGSSDGLTTGQIVGISVGAVALVAILLVLTLCIFCRESLSQQCSCLQCKSSVNPEKEGGTPDKEALELNGGSTSNKEKEG